MIKVIDSFDVARLQIEVSKLLKNHITNQISLTSLDGNDDWNCSIGKLSGLDVEAQEQSYSNINKSLNGTYIEELILKYKNFYRWRLLCLKPSQTYSIHCDHDRNKKNYRIHIPVFSNNLAYMCFYSSKPISGQRVFVQHHHLVVGKIYKTNTSSWHSAINFGDCPRWHIVGVTYE